MKRYYITDSTQVDGFLELTESEFIALFGDDTTRPYATAVYRGETTIEEVPAELQEAVLAVVEEKVNRWGLYEHREIGDSEALDIIMGGGQ